MKATTHGPLFRVCQKNRKLIHQPAQRETRRYGRRLEKMFRAMIYKRKRCGHCRHFLSYVELRKIRAVSVTLNATAKKLMVRAFAGFARSVTLYYAQYSSGVATNGAFPQAQNFQSPRDIDDPVSLRAVCCFVWKCALALAAAALTICP